MSTNYGNVGSEVEIGKDFVDFLKKLATLRGWDNCGISQSKFDDWREKTTTGSGKVKCGGIVQICIANKCWPRHKNKELELPFLLDETRNEVLNLLENKVSGYAPDTSLIPVNLLPEPTPPQPPLPPTAAIHPPTPPPISTPVLPVLAASLPPLLRRKLSKRLLALAASFVLLGVVAILLGAASGWSRHGENQTANSFTNHSATEPTQPAVIRNRFEIVLPTAVDGGGHGWRYTTSAPGNGWETKDFDDSAWQRGQSGFGNLDTLAMPVRTAWTTNEIWLRTELTLPNLADAILVPRWLHQGKLEIYINGHLTISPEQTFLYFSPPVSVLDEEFRAFQEGANTIALHAVQTGAERRVDFGLDLIALPPPKLIVREPLKTIEAHAGGVMAALFLPDQKFIISAGASAIDSTVRLWDIETGGELRLWKCGSEGVSSLAVSPTGHYAAAGGRDGIVRVWDLNDEKSDQPVREFDKHQAVQGEKAVWRVGFWSDTTVVSAGYDKTIRFWKIESGNEERLPLAMHEHRVRGLALLPQQNRFLSSGDDMRVLKWDLNKPEVKPIGQRQMDWVWSVDFSPNGRSVAFDQGVVVAIWDLENDTKIKDFVGHTDWVHTVAYSPKADLILSGGNDKMVLLWDVLSGEELCRFDGHHDEIMCVAFSPDGRRALSSSKDGSIKLWQIPVDAAKAKP